MSYLPTYLPCLSAYLTTCLPIYQRTYLPTSVADRYLHTPHRCRGGDDGLGSRVPLRIVCGDRGSIDAGGGGPDDAQSHGDCGGDNGECSVWAARHDLPHGMLLLWVEVVKVTLMEDVV